MVYKIPSVLIYPLVRIILSKFLYVARYDRLAEELRFTRRAACYVFSFTVFKCSLGMNYLES